MGGNRKHVRINNEQGTIIPYGFDDSIEEETNKIELVEGENPDYNRENAIKEFQQKKAKEGSRMLKIPNVQDLYYQRLEMKRMREEIYEKILQNVIMDINKANKDEKVECQYKLPLNIAHQPHYDFIECVWYIVERLRNEGNMFVVFYRPDLLYVNWKVKVTINNKNEKPKDKPKATKKDTKKEKYKPKTRGRGKNKKEIKSATFNLDSSDDDGNDLLASLAGIRRKL